MAGLDPRLHVFREDLADIQLQGQVSASRFVTGETYRIVRPVAGIFASADPAGGFISQGLFGENMQVFEIAHGWAWGQLETDDYVGYVRASDLAPGRCTPTHRIDARSTFIYCEPDIKTEPLMNLSYGAQLEVVELQGEFARIQDGGWVVQAHLCAFDAVISDLFDEVQKFISAPYLWGGRSSAGLDCSALIQLPLRALGIACPRDSDMQCTSPVLGARLSDIEFDAMQAGDLVFWKGHVGMMLDRERLIHANGHHMMVVVEPLQGAVSRIARLFNQPIGFRRMF